MWKTPPTAKDTGIATSAAGMARNKRKNEERKGKSEKVSEVKAG